MADRARGSARATATGGVLALSIVGRWAAVVLEGEFDLSNADQIPTVARGLVARGISEVTFDLGPVTFLDLSAVNALRAVNRLLAEHGGRLLLVGLSPLATRVLRVTGLAASLPAWTPVVAGNEPARSDARAWAGAPEQKVPDDGAAMLAAPRDDDATLTAVFRRIAGAAVSNVPGCTTASCGLVALGTGRTAAPSDPLAVELDVAQYELGHGPCLRAIRTGRRSTLRDGDAQERACLAGHGGVEDLCSVPLTLAGRAVGSLNCYGAGRCFSVEAAPYVEALGAAGGAALARVLGTARPPAAQADPPWR